MVLSLDRFEKNPLQKIIKQVAHDARTIFSKQSYNFARKKKTSMSFKIQGLAKTDFENQCISNFQLKAHF